MTPAPQPPSSFLAIVFDTPTAAQEALTELDSSGREQGFCLQDAVVVTRMEGGRIELEQTREVAAGEAMVGAGTAGLIAGLLLGFPVGAALVGLAGGTLFGLRDTGIPDPRLRKLGEDLQPGQAVLCLLIDRTGVVGARDALGRYGEVFEVALSADPDA